MNVALEELFSYRNKIKKIAICSNKEDLIREIRTGIYNIFYARKFIPSKTINILDSSEEEYKEHELCSEICKKTLKEFLHQQHCKLNIIEDIIFSTDNIKRIINKIFFYEDNTRSDESYKYYDFLDFIETFLKILQNEKHTIHIKEEIEWGTFEEISKEFDGLLISSQMRQDINSILEKYSYPLRAINGQFINITNPQQIETIQNAFHITQEQGFTATYNHLEDAITKLKIQNYRDSICDSIHAIEAVAKQISGNGDKDLAAFLKQIKDTKIIHAEFHSACQNLYAFTNRAGGIPHAHKPNLDPLQEDAETARFMLGVCSSFVSYLIEKSDTLKEIFKTQK